jgi:hypothetical protein
MTRNLLERHLRELEARHAEDVALLGRLKSDTPSGVDLGARAESLRDLDAAARIDAGVIEALKGIVATTPETTITERLGRVLYWFGCVLAAVILALGSLVLKGEGSVPLIPVIIVLGLALLAWLLGWACRFVLSGY